MSTPKSVVDLQVQRRPTKTRRGFTVHWRLQPTPVPEGRPVRTDFSPQELAAMLEQYSQPRRKAQR